MTRRQVVLGGLAAMAAGPAAPSPTSASVIGRDENDWRVFDAAAGGTCAGATSFPASNAATRFSWASSTATPKRTAPRRRSSPACTTGSAAG
jgi:hypothetical protein